MDNTWQCASYNSGKTYVTASDWTGKIIYSIDSTQASKLSSTFSKLRMYGWVWGQGATSAYEVAAHLQYLIGGSRYDLVAIVTKVADSASATRDIPISSFVSNGIWFGFSGGGYRDYSYGWVAAKATLTYIK